MPTKRPLLDFIVQSLTPSDWILAYAYWLIAVFASTVAVVLAAAFVTWTEPTADISEWPAYCRALFLANCALCAWVVMRGLSAFRQAAESVELS
ncbi:hypothetical protein [Nevskia sp.]|uniref:hypothetical protein n=1 Tax=Nevskia sp. TaxID=1929292 RepID=UPI0025E2FFA5|nr:hypothetical protein [Nevskia sp.]